MTLTVNDLPLSAALDQLGAKQDLRAASLGSVIYVGPRRTAEQLAGLEARTLAGLDSLPAGVRRRWLTKSNWSWPRLSEPRRLLEEVAAKAGARVIGAELIPHDLWAEHSWKAIAPVDRVVLLLASFELEATIAAQGRELRIKPIGRAAPAPIAGEAPKSSASDAAPWPSDATRGKGRQVHSLRVEHKPLRPVLEQLARQLGLKLEWDPRVLAPAFGLDQRFASCDVSRGSLDEVLRTLLSSSDLTYRRQGDVVRIFPRQ